MQITKRDVEILKFINCFGFCQILQIERQFKVKKPRSYQIMKRLIKAGLVIHQQIFHKSHGVFYVTKSGSEYTDSPPIKNIPKDNYAHQLAIIEVYFKLKELYPEAEWVDERRIKSEKYKKGVVGGKIQTIFRKK